jgi:hypothetical protein
MMRRAKMKLNESSRTNVSGSQTARNVGYTQPTDESHLYVEAIERKVRLSRKLHAIVGPRCGATFSLAPAFYNV